MVDTTFVGGGIAAVGCLLALSAFFSSSETAIFSLPGEWIDAQATSGDERARVLDHLHDDPHRLLVTLLVGNNVVNVAISAIVTVLVAQFLPESQAVVVTTLLASTVVLVFGEIVPKSYGLGNAEGWALRVARPITVVERLLSPVVNVFDAVTRGLNALIGGDRSIEHQYVDDEEQ